MKYGQFETNGTPSAFFAADVHGPRHIQITTQAGTDIEGEPIWATETVVNPDCRIPAEAVAISDDDWQAFLTEPGKWLWQNGQRVAASPPTRLLAEIQQDKLAALAAYRYARETGGLTVAGAEIKTDRESQALLTGAWVRVQQEPDALIDWKGENGWVQIGKADVEAIAAAVGAHVQRCFSQERSHATAIAALTTVEDVDNYDITSGW